ncbi:MAG TPA: heme-binding protein [Methylomirabilota bacterium]
MGRFLPALALLLAVAVIGAAEAQQTQTPAPTPAPARAPDYGTPVNLEQAKKILAASEAEARKNNWPVAIAIVDTHGYLIAFQRLDNTQTGSVNIALEKARTAAMFKRPTKAFEDGIAGGRMAILGLPGATPIEGGIPLMQDGKIIGAVGVSGVTSAQDAQVAKAGVESIGK